MRGGKVAAGEPAATASQKAGASPNIAPLTFLGDSFQSTTDTGWFPPDPTLAAGPFNLVSMTNGNVSIFKKNGTLVSSTGLQSFFGTQDRQTF